MSGQGRKRKYKQYITDSTVPIPRSTDWRCRGGNAPRISFSSYVCVMSDRTCSLIIGWAPDYIPACTCTCIRIVCILIGVQAVQPVPATPHLKPLKRKMYNLDTTVAVPRQTAWYWKKKSRKLVARHVQYCMNESRGINY